MSRANQIASFLKESLQATMPKKTGYMINLSLVPNQVQNLGDEKAYFEIGNANAEEKAPYYHILEDAEVIHKAGRGTKQSKGSQANVMPLGARNYGFKKVRSVDKEGVVHDIWKNEYRKNVRGSRSRVERATDYRYQGVFIKDGKTLYTVKNQNAPYYVNRHFRYIERALEERIINDMIYRFGLKPQRSKTIDDTSAIEQSISELLKYGIKGE